MPDKPNEDECVDMGFGDAKTNKKPPRITKEQSLQAARESGFAPTSRNQHHPTTSPKTAATIRTQPKHHNQNL